MRFNKIFRKKSTVTNYEGALSYKTSPEMELYTAVVTAGLSNTFYEKVDSRLKRMIQLIQKVDPEFVAKLAIYTRERMYLRSVPLILIAELSKVHRGDSLVSNTASRVIQRADEITELLAYYQLANSRTGEKKLNKLSKQIQKGIGSAFNKFDEYQFAKYNRKSDVTFKDALFLTHPKAATIEQQKLFDKIVRDELSVPYTWEVEISKIGQEPYSSQRAKNAAVKAKWEELIQSRKVGYMALLRNLRNILQAKVDAETINIVASRLADAYEVKRSKQLPFRFLAAYKELESLKLNHTTLLMDSLESAIRVSAENIAGFDITTRALLAADVSGSMFQSVSGKSKIRCYDVGLVLSMILASSSRNVVTGIFGSSWKEVNMSKSDILSNVRKLDRIEGSVGYATNAHTVINALIRQRRVMDKVLFFTDLQLWDSHGTGNSLQESWKRYKRCVSPNAKLYLFDLVGYGTTPLKIQRDDVFLIAGWSDKIFDVLEAIETGEKAIDHINKLQI